jgi:hypothetical protein
LDIFNVALVVVGVVLTILVFAFGVRRLLGLRLAPLRTLLAGLIAFFTTQAIISAIGGRRPAAAPPPCPGCGSCCSGWSSRCWSA